MRNIYWRCKENRYEGRYIMGRDKEGKAIYRSVYDRTYGGVKKRLEEAKARVVSEKPPDEGRPLTKVVREYLEGVRTSYKSSTMALYDRYLTKYIEPFFGGMPCRGLTQELVREFADRQLEKGLAAGTVRSVLALLKSGVRGICADGFFTVSLPKSKPKEIEVLSAGEQKCIETAAKESDAVNRIAIMVCLYTGIRVGELCALAWEDVDLVRGQIRIDATLQRIQVTGGKQKTRVVRMPPKSLSSIRTVPVPSCLKELLTEYKKSSDGSQVISIQGRPVEPRTLQERFKKLLGVAGVRNIKFHVIRHTFATRMLERGCDIKTLSEILGHSSSAVTMSRYAHSLYAHKQECMERLAESFLS